MAITSIPTRSESPDAHADLKPAASKRPVGGGYPIAWPITSAVLLYLAFPPIEQGVLGWIALVPLLMLIRSDLPRWRIYLGATLGGLVFWLLAISWVRLTDPSAWLGWVVMAGVLALWWPGFLALARFATRRLGLPLVVAAPVIWVGLEYLRTHVLTGFPWYFLAHTQYQVLPIIQIADLAGVWGPSLLVALVNAWIVDLLSMPLLRPTEHGSRLTAPQRRRLAVVGGALLLTLAYGGIRLAMADFRDGPRIALLQTNIRQELKMGDEPEVILAEFRHLVDKALRGGETPGLIVWPETSYPRGFPIVEPGLDDAAYLRSIQSIHPRGTIRYWNEKLGQVRTELYDWVDRIEVPMLVGSTLYWFRPDGYSKYNSAILVEPGKGPETGHPQRYDKLHLVPFGEYVPLIESFPWLTRLTPYDSDFVPNLNFGDAPVWFDLNGTRMAAVICFEDTVPHVARRFFAEAPEGGQPDVLVNLSNDGWFQVSSELDMHLAVSVFRCVENRVPMARAVNTGISAVIDGNGAIRHRLKKGTSDALTATIPLDDRRGLYSMTGDWLGLTCLAICLGLVPAGWLRGRQ